MKFWLSKYALTKGIEEVEGEPVANQVARSFNEPDDPTPPKYAKWGAHGFDVLGRDIHYTHEEAIRVANEKRTRKIISLMKALKKMEGMKFE